MTEFPRHKLNRRLWKLWFIEVVRAEERCWFDPDEAAAPVTVGPPGGFAAAVFHTLTPAAREGDLARLQSLMSAVSSEGHARAAMTSRVSEHVGLIRDQLTSWFATGKATWNPQFAGLEDDDRPADFIPLPVFDDIHWRGTRETRCDSAGAAVLVSAVGGVFERTLFGCISCRRLLTRTTPGTGWRRLRCDECRDAWTGRRSFDALDAEVRRVLDRARKRLLTHEVYPLRVRCDAICQRVVRGEISKRAALAEIRGVLPRSRRGRPARQ